jgi:hypothetical protein
MTFTDGTGERRTAQKMSLTDFQTLKTNLILPPAQKVKGKPSRHINKKQKPGMVENSKLHMRHLIWLTVKLTGGMCYPDSKRKEKEK